MNRILPLMGILMVSVLMGCTGLKNISAEDPLFTGYETSIEGGNKRIAQTIKESESMIQPRPNKTFLWMRPALARYNMLSDSAREKKFWRNKVTEPVYASQVPIGKIKNTLNNRVFHEGYFNNYLDYDTIRVSRRRQGYEFNIALNEPFKIGTITFSGGQRCAYKRHQFLQ